MAVRKVTKAVVLSSVSLTVPQADPELSASAKRLLIQAQKVEVRTAGEFADAAIVLQALTTREDEIAARKAELWDPLAKLTGAVQALFNPPLKVLKQAKETVREKMGIYALEQRNIQLAAQKRADGEAEEARLKLLAKVKKAEDAGDYDRVDILEARANSIQAATVECETPIVAGLQLRERWLFEVTDADKVPREFLMVDERLVRAEVNAKEARAKIPGVRIWSTLKPQG